MSPEPERPVQSETEGQAESLEFALVRVLDELQRLDGLRVQMATANQVLTSTQAELEQARSLLSRNLKATSAELVDELKYWQDRCSELLEARDRIEEENVRLVAELSVARSSRPATVLEAGGSPEKLTWEERKAAILLQLAREEGAGDWDPNEIDELRRQLTFFEEEIRARDRELECLRQGIDPITPPEQAEEGVGATPDSPLGLSLSAIVDVDSVVVEERRKLQEVRAEWEEKLRQAEITLSMERAKLARDQRSLDQRSAEIETRLADLQEREKRAANQSSTEEPPKRRWLSQLGLGDAT